MSWISVPLTALNQVDMCPRAQLKLHVCRWRLSSKNNHEKTLFGSHGAQYQPNLWSWQSQNLAEVTAQGAWIWNIFLLDVCPWAKLKLPVCQWWFDSKNKHQKTLCYSHRAQYWPNPWSWQSQNLAEVTAQKAWIWNLFILDVSPWAQLKLPVCQWWFSSQNNYEKYLFDSHGAPRRA